MAKLDRIQIKGFKSIKEVDLELTNLNVLIGPNASGKSNFIEFFKMLYDIAFENLQKYVNSDNPDIDSILHYGRKITKNIEANLLFGDNQYTFALEPTPANTLIFSYETALYKHGRTEKKEFICNIDSLIRPPKGPRLIAREAAQDFEAKYEYETQLNENINSAYYYNYPSISKYVKNSLESWQVYHFHETGKYSPMKRQCDINDNSLLDKHGKNLSAYLYLLKTKHKNHYNKIISTIQLVYPSFDNFILEPLKLNERMIELQWKDKDFDQIFFPYSLSDGTLRFIALATLLLQPEPPETIIIDEPELGLHPYAITVLGSLIKQASHKSQVIISTQSVNLVNQFEAEDIIVVDKVNNESKFKRLKSEDYLEWLEEYNIGELWEKNILGGRP